MNTDKATLFDGSNQDETASPETNTRLAPIVLVTNRYNLLEFMSAGMILPSPAIPKYYADLLEINPGRLPLIRGPVHESVTQLVEAEDPTAFPVAMEIDPSLLDEVDCSALTDSGTATLADGASAAWAPGGVIPLTAVPRLHFRSQADLDEHNAREYGNIRMNVPSFVTPELFQGGALPAQQLIKFVRSLETVEPGLKELLDQQDRTAGARVLAIAAAPAETSTIRELVKLIAGATEKSKLKQLPPQIVAALRGPNSETGSDTDTVLFGVAADAFRSVDRSAKWRPVELLEQIHSEFRATDPPPEVLENLQQNLRPIEGILRNERDFTPFRQGLGLNSAKALLLVLLRPEPQRLMFWPSQETGADSQVTLLAASLCGLLRGHKRLTVEFRSPELDAFLADRIAVHVHDVVPDSLRPAKSKKGITVKTSVDDAGNSHIVASHAGASIIDKTVPPRQLKDMLLDADLGNETVRQFAVNLCQQLDWLDCLSITIKSPSCTISSGTDSSLTAYQFPGSATIEYQLKEAAFLESVATGIDLSDERETDLRKAFPT